MVRIDFIRPPASVPTAGPGRNLFMQIINVTLMKMPTGISIRLRRSAP